MDVRTEIHRFLEEYFILDGKLSSLGDDASFLENGIIDSTGMLELVLFVEETFGIEVEDDEVLPSNFDSVNQLYAYVARKQPIHSVGSR
mgnify:CR=1 FL=1